MIKDFDIDALVRENVKELQPYSSARDEYVSDGSEMIFMDANENPFDNGVNRYPDPQQRSLKKALAAQKGVSAKNILIGNGSDEVLDLIFRAFCEPYQDNIITLPPTYGMYKVLAGINAVENKEVGLKPNFQPDLGRIKAVLTPQTKLIFICSPNNPTGNAFAKEDIRLLLQNFKGILVIDEAYIDFFSGESWLKELQSYPNLVVTQTLSKAYGMAGIRMGICYASEEIIQILNKVKPPYNVNELTQQRAMTAISDQEKVQKQVSDILKQRQLLEQALVELSFVTKVFPSDANFLLTRVDNAERRYGQLLKAGIVVRNRSNQYLCENTLRFTVGTSEENEKLIEALKAL